MGAVIVPLIVSGSVAIYGNQLTIRETRIDNMVKLFDDVLELKQELFKHDERPGQRGIYSDPQSSRSGLYLPVLEYESVMDQLNVVMVKLQFYYSDDVVYSGAEIARELSRTRATFNFRPRDAAHDSNDVIGAVARYKTVDETERIRSQFDILLGQMAKELQTASGDQPPGGQNPN